MKRFVILFTLFALTYSVQVGALLLRTLPNIGEIITTKGDETLRFVEIPQTWFEAEVQQHLVAGDMAKTGPYGGLAILLGDETQIRIHRNSTIIFKAVASTNNQNTTTLRLNRGSAWSRARHVPKLFHMETPSATAAIRGTDWHIRVNNDGSSQLTVLTGKIQFFNEFGTVTVNSGENAIAEIGKSPRKIHIITTQDKPQWVLSSNKSWLSQISLTKLSHSELIKEQKILNPLATTENIITAKLRLAAIDYDLHDFHAFKKLIKSIDVADLDDLELLSQYEFLLGFYELLQHNLERADSYLKKTLSILPKREQLLAQLARIGILLEKQLFSQADQHLTVLKQSATPIPEVFLMVGWLRNYSGEHELAIEIGLHAQKLYPDDIRIPEFLANTFLLLGKVSGMRKQLDRALEIDSNSPFTWILFGLYFHYFAKSPNSQAALKAYKKALDINENNATSWHYIGGYYLDIGDLESAEYAFNRAVILEPNAENEASLALLLIRLDRLNDAEQRLKRAMELEPNAVNVLQTLHWLALRRGNMDSAIDWALKAIVVSPNIASLYKWLAIAYYQNNRVLDANKTLFNAQRIDPIDPVPPLYLSLIAQDQAKPSEGVYWAKKAFRRYQSWHNISIDNIASHRNGDFNLASALANFDMNDWAQYYSQRAFDPFNSDSYFFLSRLHTKTSRLAKRRAEIQGLILEPLAVSHRNRFYDFVPRPFANATLGLGWKQQHDTEISDNQSLIVQGINYRYAPLAYRFLANREFSLSALPNSDDTAQFVKLNLGVKLTSKYSVSMELEKAEVITGNPRVRARSDSNDRSFGKSNYLYVAHYYRLNHRHRIFSNTQISQLEIRYKNPVAFGSNLSNRDFSMISNFGLDETKKFYEQGLYDGGGTTTHPIFVYGSSGSTSGFKQFENTLAESVDLSRIESNVEVTQEVSLGLKNLWRWRSWYFSTGIEFFPYKTTVTSIRYEPQPVGKVRLINGETISEFPYVIARRVRAVRNIVGNASTIFLQSEGKLMNTVHLDMTIGLSNYENPLLEKNITYWEPRLGLIWQFKRNQSLQLAVQRLLYRSDSPLLAPAATAGLAIPDSNLVSGAKTIDYQLKWNAEWFDNLFSYLSLEHQTIQDLKQPLIFFHQSHR